MLKKNKGICLLYNKSCVSNLTVFVNYLIKERLFKHEEDIRFWQPILTIRAYWLWDHAVCLVVQMLRFSTLSPSSRKKKSLVYSFEDFKVTYCHHCQ